MKNNDREDLKPANGDEDRELIMSDLLNVVVNGLSPLSNDESGSEEMLDSKLDQLSDEELEQIVSMGRFARQIDDICQANFETCRNDQVDSKLLENKAFTPARDLDAAYPHRIGKFKILALAGTGGFANVYKAYDEDLQRHVAIKVPHKNKLRTAQLRERFHREGRAAAVLDHDGIVTAYEAGTEDGLEYICYAWVDGMDLGRWLTEREERGESPIRVDEIGTAIEHLAAAIGHAHARQILHRDIKPANILVANSDDKSWYESLLVADFGLVRELDGLAKLTNEGDLMGTPAYMSPEQVRCETAGTQSDVFALGALMYELFTGNPPHLRGNYTATLMAIESGSVTSIQSLRANVPPDLRAICMKCLEFNSSGRYKNAGELHDDLVRYREGNPVTARPVGMTGKLLRWSKRNPLIAGLLCSTILSLLIGLTVTGWLLSKSLDDNQRILVAQQETERLSKSNQQALDSILGSFQRLNPEAGGKSEITAREVLDAARKDIESKFASDPRSKGRLLSELGRAYASLGLYAEGVQCHKRSLDLFETTTGPLELATIRQLQVLAHAQMEAGQLSDSLDSHNQLLDRAKSNLENSDSITKKSELALVELQLRSGNFAATIDALSSSREDFEDDDSQLRVQLLTEAYRRQGSLKKALATSKAFWRFHKTNNGDLAPETLMAKRQYVLALSDAKRIKKALPLSESLLEEWISVGKADSVNAMEQRELNGWLLYNSGETLLAQECATEAISIGTKRFAPTDSTMLNLKRLQARCLRRNDDLDQSVSVLKGALAARNKHTQTLSPSTWKVAIDLSACYRLQRKPEESVKLLKPYLKLFEGVDTVEAFEINGVRGELMLAFAECGNASAAIPLARNRVTACERRTRYDRKRVRTARIGLIQMLLQADEFEEAVAESKKLLDRWEKDKQENEMFAKFSGKPIVQAKSFLAISLAELGDFEAADRAAVAALDDPNLYKPLYHLMVCVRASSLLTKVDHKNANIKRARALRILKRSVFPRGGFNTRYLILMAAESVHRQAEAEGNLDEMEKTKKDIAEMRSQMFGAAD